MRRIRNVHISEKMGPGSEGGGKWGSGKEVETKHGSFKGTVAGKIPWAVVARRHKDNDFSDQYKLFFEL